MRIRILLLILPILIIAAFVALNWSDFMRPTPLSLGFMIVEAPLGLMMLALSALVLVVFLVFAMMLQTENLLMSRKYLKELNAQRELADKAEASRFTELRQYMEQQAQDNVKREQELLNIVTGKVEQTHQDLLLRIDQTGNSLAATVGELDDRFTRRLDPPHHSAG